MANKTNAEILKGAETSAKWGTAAGIASAAASIYSGVMGMKTAKKYAKMQQRASEMQARLNEIATERNIAYQTRQTADQISDIKRQGKQVIGSQLAAMAASGMSTASGSAQALLRSTGYSVGRDISTLQANLLNSAYEQRRQTAIENIGLRYQGAMASMTGRSEGFGQLAQGFQGAMSAATMVAERWDNLNKLQFYNQAQQPAIDSTSPAYIRSAEDWGNYFQYPSMTGLYTSGMNINSPINISVPKLQLTPLRQRRGN